MRSIPRSFNRIETMGCGCEGWGQGRENSILESIGQEGTMSMPDLEAKQEKTRMKQGKYKRPNPKGPRIIIKSRALPCIV